MRFHLFFAFISFLPLSGNGQTDIEGIVNAYAVVEAIDHLPCQTSLVVDDPASFSAGDRVLVIQMKGAVIDQSDTEDFGSVQDIAGAGNWEFADIESISGATIFLNGSLQRFFDPGGRVQLVKVPVYADATVTGTLTAEAWQGQKGGVLAVWVAGTLNLEADLDVSGLGFRGGTIHNNPDGACGSGSLGFAYPLDQPGNIWQEGGAEKGEGIAEVPEEIRAGRGELVNGGGGGNKHNTGGGGGGNLTSGGVGGNELQGCPVNNSGGYGGANLDNFYQMDRLFLGGGGGCGDDNNDVGSVGENGGGLIMIIAETINGNGQTIRANGNDQQIVGSGIADGAGGGGAGGTIWLHTSAYNGLLFLELNGGDGGDQAPFFGCVGPGGGGGVGALVSSIPLSPTVIVSQDPGAAGMFTAAGFSCTNSSYGASPGAQWPQGALLSDSIYMAVPGGSIAIELGADTTICQGESLILASEIAGAEYLWQDGSEQATYTVVETGLYWLEVSIGACEDRDSIVVEVMERPEPDLGPDTLICLDDFPFLLLPATDPMAEISWQDGSKEGSYSATGPGLYSVTVELGDCIGTDSLNLDAAICERCEFYAPNAFTPNFDGINDEFRLYSNCTPLNYRMQIFSRWGGKLFETDEFATGWDGSRNGRGLDPGVYVYLIELEVEDQEGRRQVVLEGDVLLLR